MFKYETHLHTAETSKCARSGGAEMARHFASLGYAGIFVTDHFFNGNTTVARELPWEERVRRFLVGWEEAKAAGEPLGLDVFFAWEYSYGWAHFLTYGLPPAWLYAHPDVLDWPVAQYLETVRRDGGYIVHAHPMRKTGNPVMPVIPALTDAVEIVNGGRSDEENERGAAYARAFSLPVTAGSDIHVTAAARHAGVLSEERFTDGAAYARAVIGGRVTLFCDAPARA